MSSNPVLRTPYSATQYYKHVAILDNRNACVAEIQFGNSRFPDAQSAIAVALAMVARINAWTESSDPCDWAKAFCEMARDLGHDIDPRVMVTWFHAAMLRTASKRATFQVRNGPVDMPCDHCSQSVSDHLCPAVETGCCEYEREEPGSSRFDTACGKTFWLGDELELYDFCVHCGKRVSEKTGAEHG